MDLPPEASVVATQLAGTMATTLFTSAWNAVSRRFASTVSDEDPEQETRVVARLERDRQTIEHVDDGSRDAVEQLVRENWAETALDFLRKHPDKMADLRALLAEIQGVPSQAPVDESVRQSAKAIGKGSAITQVGKNQYNFGTSR